MIRVLYLFLWLMFFRMPEEQRIAIPTNQMAYMVGLSEDEFNYFAQVVEAESDRSEGCTNGKIYVAACIWDRLNGSPWPDTLRGVLDQSGQFSTTSGGSCWCKKTPGSELAIVEAYISLQNGDIPTNLYYFNCIGYNYGTPYGKIGDNYFMTSGDEEEFVWNDDMYNDVPDLSFFSILWR